MRVLLTCGPVYSHFAPMVAPVAEAIGKAGHEVAVATVPSLAGDLDRLGLAHLSLSRMLTALQRAADPDQARHLGLIPEELAKPLTGATFGRLFAAFGLRPVPDTATLVAYPWVSWLPASWYPAELHSRAHRHYRAPDQSTVTLDPAIAGLSADRLPLNTLVGQVPSRQAAR